jgi:hypothetical protein
LPISFQSPYHSRPNGSASEISSTPHFYMRGRTVVNVHGYGKRFVVRADEKLSAPVELEREVLTVTFYLESIRQQ